MMNGLLEGINNIFNLFYFLIILRIFLSWIPTIDKDRQPWKAVIETADLYLNLFRKIVPPIANIDFSPIVAIIVLQLVQNALIYVIYNLKGAV